MFPPQRIPIPCSQTILSRILEWRVHWVDWFEGGRGSPSQNGDVLNFEADTTTSESDTTVPVDFEVMDYLAHDCDCNCCGECLCSWFDKMTYECNHIVNRNIHIQFLGHFQGSYRPCIRLAINGRAYVDRTDRVALSEFGRVHASRINRVKSLFVYNTGSRGVFDQTAAGPHLDVISTILECLGWRSELKLSRFSLKVRNSSNPDESFLHASELEVERFVAVFKRYTEKLTYFRFMAEVDPCDNLSMFSFSALLDAVRAKWCDCGSYLWCKHIEVASRSIWHYVTITAIRDFCAFEWLCPLIINCYNREGTLQRFVNGACSTTTMSDRNLVLKYLPNSEAVRHLFRHNRVFAKITYICPSGPDPRVQGWELLGYWRAVFEGSTPFVCLDITPQNYLSTEFIAGANLVVSNHLANNHFLLRFKPFVDVHPAVDSAEKGKLVHNIRTYLELNNARRYRMGQGVGAGTAGSMVNVLADLNGTNSELESVLALVKAWPHLLPK